MNGSSLPMETFGSENAARVKAREFPRHYGARPTQVIDYNSPHADKNGWVWVIVRDGPHYLRINGEWW